MPSVMNIVVVPFTVTMSDSAGKAHHHKRSTQTTTYFTCKDSIPKSPPAPLSRSLKGSLMLPVFVRQSCVYSDFNFCNSASTAAVFAARDTKTPCWACSVDAMAEMDAWSIACKDQHRTRTLWGALLLSNCRRQLSFDSLREMSAIQGSAKEQYLDRTLTPLKTFLHFLGHPDKVPDIR